MHVLTITVFSIIAVIFGVTETTEKKSTVENAIKKGLAAICRESSDHLWHEESEQCIQLVTVTRDRGETMGRDEE